MYILVSRLLNPVYNNFHVWLMILTDCRPIQIWSFNRHGTRYPSRESIEMLQTLQKLKENIIKNYDTRRSYPETGRLCDRDLDVFRRFVLLSFYVITFKIKLMRNLGFCGFGYGLFISALILN